MTDCAVYLDGALIGKHYGVFCDFEFILPIESAVEHTLVVSVDNRFDAYSIPQAVVDCLQIFFQKLLPILQFSTKAFEEKETFSDLPIKKANLMHQTFHILYFIIYL